MRLPSIRIASSTALWITPFSGGMASSRTLARSRAVRAVSRSPNPRGQVTGQAQNGLIDPLTGFPAAHAVVWEHGEILDLGTLGG
jgi:hypothetical protein